MRSPPEADAIHRHRTGLAPEIAILNGGVRPDLLDCPKWLALAPPAFALASPSPRPGGARAKAGGAVPLVEPELSTLSLSTARKTVDDGNDGAQVTTLGQRDPIDYPNRSAVDYLDHAHISPKLFHIWLWCEWWETHGHRPDVLAIIQNLPTALIEWFGQMFMYAHDSKAAIVQVNNLLGPEGPFANEEVIRTDLGGRFFFSLAEASPSEALKCLERSVGTWNQNLLREFKSGRREVVAALERIAYDPRLFSRAAKLILQLAGTENEHWANNASGVFKKLFSLRPGRFSPTAASPAERFPILEEASIRLKKQRGGSDSKHANRHWSRFSRR